MNRTAHLFRMPEHSRLTARTAVVTVLTAAALAIGGLAVPLLGARAAWLAAVPLALVTAVLWALFQSETRYRTLFTAMNEGFQLCELVYDAQGKAHDFRFLDINRAYERHTGLRREQVVGRTVRQLLPDLEEQWIEFFVRVAETGQPESCESFAHSLGRWYDVFAFSPRKGRFAAVLVDVTDRKRVEETLRQREEQLRASESKFRSVFEQAAIGMGRVRFADAQWIDVNDAFCRMLGYSHQEMLSTPWPRITHPEDVGLDLIPFQRMAAGEIDSYTVEKRFIHRDGHHVWARLTLSLVRDAGGRPDYEIAIIEDIGDRKRAEEAQREATRWLVEADQRKNEFLAVLSHELRNPLGPILNSVYVLDRAEGGTEQAHRARQVIERQARHMTRLIDDLLDVTRISRGKIKLQRERVDLDAIARATADDHREVFARNGVALEVHGAGGPVWVQGDATRLMQVIGNLLNNSAKFTQRGGTTVLSVGAGDHGEAAIRVRDDGAGMAREALERVFDPFVQEAQTLERTRGGLGLGLALVKGLVEMHGGSVSAHSEGEDRGAEFVVTLPQLSRTGPGADGQSPVLPSRPVARRILIVEDNVDAAETLRDVLALGNHEVAVAHTGPEGLTAARAHKPDVILCDLGLPGLDGYGVARAVRADPDAALRSTFLVALSGYALQEDVAQSKEAGFDRHLAKPATLEALQKVLAEAPARAR